MWRTKGWSREDEDDHWWVDQSTSILGDIDPKHQ